jgi:hypothetical protein
MTLTATNTLTVTVKHLIADHISLLLSITG